MSFQVFVQRQRLKNLAKYQYFCHMLGLSIKLIITLSNITIRVEILMTIIFLSG